MRLNEGLDSSEIQNVNTYNLIHSKKSRLNEKEVDRLNSVPRTKERVEDNKSRLGRFKVRKESDDRDSRLKSHNDIQSVKDADNKDPMRNNKINVEVESKLGLGDYISMIRTGYRPFDGSKAYAYYDSKRDELIKVYADREVDREDQLEELNVGMKRILITVSVVLGILGILILRDLISMVGIVDIIMLVLIGLGELVVYRKYKLVQILNITGNVIDLGYLDDDDEEDIDIVKCEKCGKSFILGNNEKCPYCKVKLPMYGDGLEIHF